MKEPRLSARVNLRRKAKIIKKASRTLTAKLVPLASDLFQLFPYGVNMIGEGIKPVLLMRDLESKHHLSVPLNPIEAGVTLAQSNKVAKPTTTHQGTKSIFQSLGLEITRATFEEIKAGRQFMRLTFKNHPSKADLVLPAEDVISLCLFLDVPIFASQVFMQQNMGHLSELEGMLDPKRIDPQLSKRIHTYIQ